MAVKVRWSPESADDIEQIAEYITHDSLVYAKAVVKAVMDKTKYLELFPNS